MHPPDARAASNREELQDAPMDWTV
jgi:hypothetical protein